MRSAPRAPSPDSWMLNTRLIKGKTLAYWILKCKALAIKMRTPPFQGFSFPGITPAAPHRSLNISPSHRLVWESFLGGLALLLTCSPEHPVHSCATAASLRGDAGGTRLASGTQVKAQGGAGRCCREENPLDLILDLTIMHLNFGGARRSAGIFLGTPARFGFRPYIQELC